MTKKESVCFPTSLLVSAAVETQSFKPLQYVLDLVSRNFKAVGLSTTA